jgi:hypothetical protein
MPIDMISIIKENAPVRAEAGAGMPTSQAAKPRGERRVRETIRVSLRERNDGAWAAGSGRAIRIVAIESDRRD